MAGCEAVHAILVLPTCIPYVAASYKLKGSEGRVAIRLKSSPPAGTDLLAPVMSREVRRNRL